MSDDEMRIAIAEHLGWKPDTRSGYFINESKQEITPEWCLPNFPEDLNACHEMEKSLSNEQQKRLYVDHLAWLMRKGEFTVMAPARQRAEAFLRCVGKWSDL